MEISPVMPTNYKYFLGKGNNPEIVRKVMATRSNWEEVNDFESMTTNFKW